MVAPGPGAYGSGAEQPTPFDRALGLLWATGGVASGSLAAALYRLDSIVVDGKVVTVAPGGSQRPGVKRATLHDDEVTMTNGFACTSPTRTLVDLAAALDDATWEQVLESSLRLRLTTVGQLEDALSSRHPGNRSEAIPS